MTMTTTGLFRYPVKGLPAQSLTEATLAPGKGLPDDRRFALLLDARADGLDRPVWRPKHHFLQLAKHARLAALRLAYDAETVTLALYHADRQLVQACLTAPTERQRLEAAVTAFMADALAEPVRLLEADGFLFSDNPEPLVSLLNLASVADLERAAGAPVDPRRFRANVWIQGAPAWSELDWTGRTLRLGSAVAEVVGPIDRCAATTVNPETAERDLNLPRTLQKTYDHTDCGVFVRILEEGFVSTGDVCRPL